MLEAIHVPPIDFIYIGHNLLYIMFTELISSLIQSHLCEIIWLTYVTELF